MKTETELRQKIKELRTIAAMTANLLEHDAAVIEGQLMPRRSIELSHAVTVGQAEALCWMLGEGGTPALQDHLDSASSVSRKLDNSELIGVQIDLPAETEHPGVLNN